MKNDNIAVKINYEQNRSNPAEVFEAMGLYIRFTTDIGQIILNSVGEESTFDLSLDEIEKGSIISWLSPNLDKKLKDFCKKYSNALVREFISLPDEITDEDIEMVAVKIQEKIQDEKNPVFPVIINQKALKHAAKNYSAANEKLYSTEPVEFISYNNGVKEIISINTHQYLSKASTSSELEKSPTHELHLVVISPKNIGNGAWSFKSPKLNKRFDARILNAEWLTRYQAQIIRPIGPKDIIVADVRYSTDKETSEITKAEILNIKDIIRAKSQSNINYE